VVDIHEVAAGKLVALLDRKAARDLFDARRILEIPNLDWRLIRAAVLAFGASGRRDWREASLDDIGGDPKELRDKLAICLPQGMFRDAGGVKAWIDESVKVCREGLRDLFNRTPGERRFLEALLDRGEVDPDGLDAPEEVRARIAQMPMLAWKAQHVLAHKTAQDRRDTS
jgi:hypothetical protein